MALSRRLVWLAVPALALVELAAHAYFARRAPRIEDWEQLRPLLTELRKHDELVVVAPHWAEPLARHAFADALMPLQQLARPDVTRFAKAIEVSILGERSEELAGFREVAHVERGGFRLRMLANPAPVKVRFDFVEQLGPERADVFVAVGGGAQRPCQWNSHARVVAGGLHGHVAFPRERFECGGGENFFVGVTVIDDQDYRPRQCIWAHPTADGPLVVRYRSIPLGSMIYGYAGLSYFLHRDGTGTPVELEVRIDGESMGRYVHHDELGWHRFSLPTKSHAGGTADVEFIISSEAVAERHFCFYADTR